jgi:phage/plasmid-associated DNA primase
MVLQNNHGSSNTMTSTARASNLDQHLKRKRDETYPTNDQVSYCDDASKYTDNTNAIRYERIVNNRILDHRALNVWRPLHDDEQAASLLHRFLVFQRIICKQIGATKQTDFRILQFQRNLFGYDDNTLIIPNDVLERIWQSRSQFFDRLHQLMDALGLAREGHQHAEIADRFRALVRMKRVVNDSYAALAGIAHTRDLSDATACPTLPSNPMTSMMSDQLGKDGKPVPWNDQQKVIRFTLEYCLRNRIRKDPSGTGYYTEIKNRQGIGTHAWRREGDIGELLWKACQPIQQFPGMWFSMTRGRSMHRVVSEYLQHCNDPEIPILHKHQRTWAFENGIYNGSHNQFYPWSHPALHDDIVACKYFPVDFNDEEYTRQMEVRLENGDIRYDWRRIQTPHVDDILIDQQLPEEVRDWWYILSGKMAYRVREMDNWQIQLFIKGVAGTGKSTLLQLLIWIWDPVDVGFLSNTVERNFPLEGLLQCFVYFGMDISEAFGLDQTLWQSMVSGEGIAINRKHKVRISVDFDIPGMMAGNRTPPYKDNAGSVSRRMPTLEFMISIQENQSKPHLQEELRVGIGAFLKKMCSAYADIGMRRGNKPIWKLLPPYFIDTRKRLRRETNLLEAFFDSDQVILHKGYDMPLELLKQSFQTYCLVVKGKPPPEFVHEFYKGIFASRLLTEVTLENKKYRHGTLWNGGKKSQWVNGIDLASNVSSTPQLAQANVEQNANAARAATLLLMKLRAANANKQQSASPNINTNNNNHNNNNHNNNSNANKQSVNSLVSVLASMNTSRIDTIQSPSNNQKQTLSGQKRKQIMIVDDANPISLV